ncbi:unnamed protein product [Adineta ricciae]|uniref:Uncharacterized protein n=1 Tax=Adineta ricciae TaxID=249248 RepID=A0A814ERI9_ADIRI|nr:unnamed protein product [Adineta ricciae]
MSKEQYSTNLPSETRMNTTNDLPNNAVLTRTAPPYRSISAKRPRDPSHRKSVSFNDVPIVHEVPSHDVMRGANCDAYRSWLYTDPTSPIATIPSLYSTQAISPFNSTSITAQKLHANRLSSALYATSSTTITPNRMPDWAVRTKTQKPTSTTEETNSTNENNSPTSASVSGLQITSEEKLNKEPVIKDSYQPIVSSQSASVLAPSSTTSTSEMNEDKKYSFRSTSLIPETEHVRALSFMNGSLANSSMTYASILSTNISQTNNSTNESMTYPNSRLSRARSAITPSTAGQSSIRTNDPISISPLRATAVAATATTTVPFSVNAPTPATRAILRPSTVAFQCTPPPPLVSSNTNSTNNASAAPSTTATNIINTTNPPSSSSTTATHLMKPPTIAPRFHASAATTAAAHSRFVLPQNRPLTSATLSAAAMKYTLAHPTTESSFSNTNTPFSAMPRAPPTAYPRSRSANVLSMRRTQASSINMVDGQSHGNATASSSTDPNNHLYATTRRSPNVRQNYGSYYINRVLLPTTTN